MADNIELLERERPLRHLIGRVDDLARRGRCVVLDGEPGIGKTSLMAHLRARLGGRALRWWQGSGELLSEPLPWAPLLECLDQLPAAVAGPVRQGVGQAGALLAGLLSELRSAASPTVWVIDDLQWADDATLDVVRYVGRRLADTHGLLLLACRSDALAPGQTLSGLLAHLEAAGAERITLLPLSAQAVQTWAQRSGNNGQGLHALTGGNPFFLAQVLAHGPAALPASVREAVLGRVGALPAASQALLNWLCVRPVGAPLALLGALVPDVMGAAQPALHAGLVSDDAGVLDFRHELTRQALAASLAPRDAQRLHAGWHAVLAARGQAPHLQVEHAHHAGLGEVVLAQAPAAAAAAATAGWHRQAAHLLGLRLHWTAASALAERAQYLEARAQAWTLGNALREAMADHECALALRETLGDALGVGRNCLWLARLRWQYAGDPAQAMPWAQRALDTLMPLAPSLELAQACSTRSHLHLVSDDMVGTLHWGLRGLALAEDLAEPKVLSHALNNVGTAWARSGEMARGMAALDRSGQLAEAAGAQDDVARVHLNRFLVLAAERRMHDALAQADDGVTQAERHGLDVYAVRLLVRRAHARLAAGRWHDAADDLRTLAREYQPAPMESATAEYVAALLAVRGAEPGARGRLRRAVTAMRDQQVDLWFVPTVSALAESAWLADDPAGVVAEAQAAWARFGTASDGWRQGELALWLHRCRAAVPSAMADRPWPLPVQLELAGDVAGAAHAWEALGCPYDAALALANGDVAAQQASLSRLRALGAVAAERVVARRLRAVGQGRGTRGAYRHARQDALGLTPRERQVLRLLAQALSNREIAQILGRSERTVEKHVATLLAKLQVSNRQAAAQRLAAFEDG